MDEQAVRELARAADLSLGDERLGLIALQLGAWLAAANELSRKLEGEQHRAIVPITVFRQPTAERGEE